MKISGFSFVRNAFLLSYPLEESIQSLLDICDELVIAVGNSEDHTLEFLKSLKNSKLKLIETVWNENLNHDGLIYSQQTNIALQNCSGDWCFYLQADEVLHEKDFETILKDIKKADENKRIEGLLFRYVHFYGSYDYIGSGRQWYRREIRAFRNEGNVLSWGDAQGFRKLENDKPRKMNVVETQAKIFHYGWVRPPKAQTKKILKTNEYYHAMKFDDKTEIANKEFDYNSAFELELFKDSHPKYMNKKIEKDKEWTYNFNPSKLKRKPFVMKLLDIIEKKTGCRIGEYRDFRLLR